VIACGANAILVGRTAGVELPLVMRPRQSFTTGARHAGFPDDAPMVIGATPCPHVRPEAGSGAIFGWEYAWNTKNVAELNGAKPSDALIEPVFPAEPLRDARFPSLTLALLARQFGHADGEGFADACYLRGVRHNIGYYVSRSGEAAYTLADDGSPRPYESERAIIDAHPEVNGLFVSVAHVGHGIMSSPGAGEILARKILGQPQPDPLFEQFSFDTHWVAHDENAL
jgi:glycine/D-amino acid oxidase-like deaminating enzyme